MTTDIATTAQTPAVHSDAYTYRDLLDMLDFIEDYGFDASEADEDEWVAVIKEALAAGWTRNA